MTRRCRSCCLEEPRTPVAKAVVLRLSPRSLPLLTRSLFAGRRSCRVDVDHRLSAMLVYKITSPITTTTIRKTFGFPVPLPSTPPRGRGCLRFAGPPSTGGARGRWWSSHARWSQNWRGDGRAKREDVCWLCVGVLVVKKWGTKTTRRAEHRSLRLATS